MIENQQYYEAHQLYRTVYFRYLNWKKFKELQDLLFEGAILLLSRDQFNSGADLAGLYLESLSKDPDVKTVVSREPQVYQRIGELFARIPAQTPERLNFMTLCFKLDAEVFDRGLLHYNLAVALFREKNFVDSRWHFLRSSPSSAEECCQMLVEYQVSQGSHTEVDLFVTQFILQVLCVRPVNLVSGSMDSLREAVNKEDCFGFPSLDRSRQHSLAKRTLSLYVLKHPKIGKQSPPFQSPLLNFCWFLLMAVTAGDPTLLQILANVYAPSLERDQEYRSYIKKIGHLYFGVPLPPQRPSGGIFGNLLQSLLDDGSDDEAPASSTQQRSQPSQLPRQSRPLRSVQAEELD